MQTTPSIKVEQFQPRLACVALGTLLMVVQPAHTLAGAGAEPPRAAVFSDSLPGFDQTLAREISGENKNLHEVMIAVEKSSIAFQFMSQVRNKALEAYQEVMRMQV